jgi:hypothetical protein
MQNKPYTAFMRVCRIDGGKIMDKINVKLIKNAIDDWAKGNLSGKKAMFKIALVMAIREPSTASIQWAESIIQPDLNAPCTCPNCGTVFMSAVKTDLCTCDAPYISEKSYCTKCGKDMREE